MIVSVGNYDLKYFSFTLNSGREGLSGGIIALIVILSIIVVLVVAYFVLRKLGIISFSIFIPALKNKYIIIKILFHKKIKMGLNQNFIDFKLIFFL